MAMPADDLHDYPMSAGVRRALSRTGVPPQPTRRHAHMAQETRANSGFLARNDKGDNPNRPDWTGKLDIDGTGERRVAGWVKTSKAGNKYLSLSIDSAPDNGGGGDQGDLDV